jgi:hypothetical protein
VERRESQHLSEIDATLNVAEFNRDPIDAPVLLDETRGLIFSKNKIFDAQNLERLIYSLPAYYDVFDGATETVYALDAERGRIATRGYVYELGRYDVIASTVVPNATQQFFASDGALWTLSVSKGALFQQLLD